MTTNTMIDTSLNLSKTNTSERKGIVKLKKSSVPKEKHIHLILRKEDIPRLEKLQSAVYPHTQTEVFTNALQLFEEMLDKHNEGYSFYAKRSDNELEKFDVFG